MTTPWRRLACTLVLVTLGSLGLARDAAAYWGVTTLDYGGQLTGYARVEQEAWDPDSDWVCLEEAEPWCLEGIETVYAVGLEHELRTPTGALHASGAGSSPNGWLQLNLAPHTPAVYGTWTHHGRYFTVEEQYLYVFNPNTWSYDISPLGVYWVQFGGHSPQVSVPEPSPPPLLVHYVHTDALGSVRLLTNAAGQPVTACDYLPFGQDWQSTGGLDDCRFAQTERSPDTGAGTWEDLNYAGARYYHTQSGRFTSVDPGHAGMNLFDPQSWNGYAYARNNPLVYVDPEGRDIELPSAPMDRARVVSYIEEIVGPTAASQLVEYSVNYASGTRYFLGIEDSALEFLIINTFANDIGWLILSPNTVRLELIHPTDPMAASVSVGTPTIRGLLLWWCA